VAGLEGGIAQGKGGEGGRQQSKKRSGSYGLAWAKCLGGVHEERITALTTRKTLLENARGGGKRGGGKLKNILVRFAFPEKSTIPSVARF